MTLTEKGEAWMLYTQYKAIVSLVVMFGFVLIPSKFSFALSTESLRHQRYCEIIFSKGKIFEVYSTIGLNDCAQDLWDDTTVQSVKKETGAFYVYLNGPRRFIADGAKNTQFIDAESREFSHLAMRKVGVLHLSLRDILLGAAPFRQHRVERQTTWIYASGNRVYELINPAGEVYVMQSYALSPTQQSEKDLMNLRIKLNLPQGWQYKTGILQHQTDLKAIHNEAVLVQDNLHNTYLLASHDFLS